MKRKQEPKEHLVVEHCHDTSLIVQHRFRIRSTAGPICEVAYFDYIIALNLLQRACAVAHLVLRHDQTTFVEVDAWAPYAQPTPVAQVQRLQRDQRKLGRDWTLEVRRRVA